MAELYRPLDYLALPLEHMFAFVDATDEQRSKALMLAFYCAQVLNSGRIERAATWSEWQWITRVRISTAPGADAPGLWTWRGEDLLVLCYSAEYEADALHKRRKGTAAANARWGTKEEIPDCYANAYTDADASAYTDAMQGKERQVKERKGGASKLAPPQDPLFEQWLAALRPAHPSMARSNRLAVDVLEKAREAYDRFPKAAEFARLLTDYMQHRLQADRNNERFYRPRGQGHFFRDLEDVVCHAERWAKEVGWGRKRTAPPALAPTPTSPPISPEQAQQEFAAMRQELKP